MGNYALLGPNSKGNKGKDSHGQVPLGMTGEKSADDETRNLLDRAAIQDTQGTGNESKNQIYHLDDQRGDSSLGLVEAGSTFNMLVPGGRRWSGLGMQGLAELVAPQDCSIC